MKKTRILTGGNQRSQMNKSLYFKININTEIDKPLEYTKINKKYINEL